jgi:ribosome-associated toxin RatA of RatAB toxin-antitoxin module
VKAAAILGDRVVAQSVRFFYGVRGATCAGLTLAAIAWLGVLLIGPAGAMSLDADELKRLNAGEAIVHVSADDSGEADGLIEAAIVVAAPPSRIYDVMLDCTRAVKFLPALTGCRVLNASPDGLTDLREHRSKWISILPETVSIFRSQYVKNREIRFEKAGGDLKFLKGSWMLEPLKGGTATKLNYRVRVGVSGPVPGFMVRGALEQDVPKFLQALRREAMAGQ